MEEERPRLSRVGEGEEGEEELLRMQVRRIPGFAPFCAPPEKSAGGTHPALLSAHIFHPHPHRPIFWPARRALQLDRCA